MSLSPRAIAMQGFGFPPRLVSMQGLWPFSSFDEASAASGARARLRKIKLEARLEELDRALREWETRRATRIGSAMAPAAIGDLITFRTDREVAERVASAIAAVRQGAALPEVEFGALRAVLAAARQQVADAAARRARNRWRAIVLVALWMLM